jgi:putative ABC transport system permease protein
MDFILTAIIQGLGFSGLGLGIYLSLRVFNIPDITTDGSYTLGGAVTAVLLTSGMHPVICTLLAMLAGAMAGTCTGVIYTRLRVNPLLAGILVMTALYSINLVVMGRSNIPLIGTLTGISLIDTLPPTRQFTYLLLIALALLFLLNRFLRSDFGIAMRATGNSESMARSMSVNTHSMKVVGLALANALTALSGSLITQYQGYADINMGIGIVITGLASVMVGETLFRPLIKKKISFHLFAIVAGAILFRLSIAAALSAGLDPNYLRLITALLVLIIVAFGSFKKTATT